MAELVNDGKLTPDGETLVAWLKTQRDAPDTAPFPTNDHRHYYTLVLDGDTTPEAFFAKYPAISDGLWDYYRDHQESDPVQSADDAEAAKQASMAKGAQVAQNDAAIRQQRVAQATGQQESHRPAMSLMEKHTGKSAQQATDPATEASAFGWASSIPAARIEEKARELTALGKALKVDKRAADQLLASPHGFLTEAGRAVVLYLHEHLQQGHGGMPAIPQIQRYIALCEQGSMKAGDYLRAFPGDQQALYQLVLEHSMACASALQARLQKTATTPEPRKPTQDDATRYMAEAADADDFVRRRANVQRGAFTEDFQPPLVNELQRLKTVLTGDTER